MRKLFFRLVVPSFKPKRPRAILAVVVLPEPFGPINVTISPLCTLIVMPLTSQFLFFLTPALVNFISTFSFLDILF